MREDQAKERWGLERSSARLEELRQRLAKEGSRLELGFVKDLSIVGTGY